jgi:hypothetical protein
MKRCRTCKSKFEPFNSLQIVCGPVCALKYAQKEKIKAAEGKAKEQRKWVREQKERIKPRRDWIKEAQKEFNSFIRARDAHLPCICCGEWGKDEQWKPGGQYDAGHYLSVGSHPELRFDEANCHKQLKSCNAGEGKYAHKRRTVGEEYRLRLIEKIGVSEVERLEGPHEPKKYTIDDLKEIKAKYRALTRELQKQREAA